MKSITDTYATYATALGLGLLATPAFADPGHLGDDAVYNFYNYALGAGSFVFILVGIWVLRKNRQRPPRGK